MNYEKYSKNILLYNINIAEYKKLFICKVWDDNGTEISSTLKAMPFILSKQIHPGTILKINSKSGYLKQW